MKRIILTFGLVLTALALFSQIPRIRLNQVQKDTLWGSILISSPVDSNLTYSRDFYIGPDTSLNFYGTVLVAGGGGGGSFVTTTILSDSLANYILKAAGFGGDVSGTYDNIIVTDDSHNHIIGNVDGLQTALDGKSNTGHTHVISDISGLQTALDGKQAQLNGTGFVKASGTTISYDNSTYLTTETDGSVTNEGSLSVGAGGANDAVINSNTSGSTGVTIAGSGIVSVSESGSTITISASGGGSGTVTDVIAGTQISGMGMSIATSTTTPTISTSITDAANFRTAIGAGTLSTEVDGSVTNEGSLTVGAGTASTSVISSNTSGSTDVTLTAGSNITLSESGNNITIAASGGGSSFNNLTESGDTIKVDKSFGADSLNFFVDAGTSRVGIGTTAPSDKLDIKGGILIDVDSSFAVGGSFAPFTAVFRGDDDATRNLNFRLEMRSNFANNRGAFSMRRARVDNSTGLLTGVLNNDFIGSLGFQAAFTDGNLTNVSASVAAYADADATATGAAVRLSFLTGTNTSDQAERLTIKSDGKIGMGTTTPTDELHNYRASGSIFTRTESASIANGETSGFSAEANSRLATIGVTRNTGSTNAVGFIYLNARDNDDNYLWVDSTITYNLRISQSVNDVGNATSQVVGGQSSDIRLKTDLGVFPYGLNEVMQLKPSLFSYKQDYTMNRNLGFYAQEVLPIIPEVVFDTKETLIEGEPTRLYMQYVFLVPVLTKAIQEQQAIIESQKAEIEQLKTQYNDLLQRIITLENK